MISVEPITVAHGDNRVARKLADDLLLRALVLAPAGSSGEGLGYRAAWLGSPAALGAFGVHRDAEVSPAALAVVLEGKSAWTRYQARRPRWIRDRHGQTPIWGVTNVLVTLEPAGVWSETDGALIAGAEQTLEEVRQTWPLAAPRAPRGRLAAGYASGLAAVAIAPEQEGDVPARVQIVVFGAERFDGALVSPSVQAFMNAVPAMEAAVERPVRSMAEPAADRHLVGRPDAPVDPRIETAVGRALRAEEELVLLRARRAEEQAPPHLRGAVDVGMERVRVLRHRAEAIAAGDAEQPAYRRVRGYPRDRFLEPGAEWLARLRDRVLGAEQRISGEREVMQRQGFAEAVEGRKAVERLADAIGAERADRLARRAAALSSWMAELPDGWVSARHAETADALGLVDRGAARESRRVEAYLNAAKGQFGEREAVVDQLRGELELAALDGADRRTLAELNERLHAAEREAGAVVAELRHFQLQAELLHASGRHVDEQVARHADRLVPALAYTDELARRLELGRHREVGRSVPGAERGLPRSPGRATPEAGIGSAGLGLGA